MIHFLCVCVCVKKMRFVSESNKCHAKTAGFSKARQLQHTVDMLEGVLYVDRWDPQVENPMLIFSGNQRRCPTEEWRRAPSDATASRLVDKTVDTVMIL